MTKFYCYHGSPGTFEDFSLLQNCMPDHEFIDMYNSQNKIDQKGTILAYSFGAVKALNDLITSHEFIDEVILISPYAFPSKNKVVNTIVNLPVLGNVLLDSFGKNSMDLFVRSSCYPLTPPASYKALVTEFSKKEVIKSAIIEKKQTKIPEDEKLKALNVKVTIIRGELDLTSPVFSQIAPLQEIFSNCEVIEVKDANHALTWTHPETLSFYIHGNRGDTSSLFKVGYHEGISPLNNVYSFLESHLNNCPDREILKWVEKNDLESWDKNIDTPLPHKSITASDFYQKTEAVAAGYRKLGLQKDDRVILFLPMSLDLYTALFALLKIGATPVLLDFSDKKDQLAAVAKSVRPRAMISTEFVFNLIKKTPTSKSLHHMIVCGPHEGEYSSSLEELEKTTFQVLTETLQKDETAIIAFTKDSSGAPIGVNRTHKFLAAQHYALDRTLPYKDGDTDLPAFPIFSLNNLAAGVPTIIPAFDVSAPEKDDTLIYLAQMKACNATCATLNASLLTSSAKYCLENNITQDGVRRIVTVGAPVYPDNMVDITTVAPSAEAWVIYGSTEAGPISYIETKNHELVDEGVNAGKIVSGLQYKFIKINEGPVLINKESDWNDLIIPNGEVGELIVAGDHVCDSYFKNNVAFSRSKIRDEQGIIWHRTGDLARIDDQNNIWLMGQVHDTINR